MLGLASADAQHVSIVQVCTQLHHDQWVAYLMSVLWSTKTGQKGCGTQYLNAARLDGFWCCVVWFVGYNIHCSQTVAHYRHAQYCMK